jgi:phosphoribosylamine--glycine ligase
MNILVLGSGGREHALVWKIAQSPLVEKIYCAPGNAGIAELATCVDISVGDSDRLIAFAKESGVDLIVVGPEDPLAAGIVDRFAEAGLSAFGPSGAAARLEASKVFAKEFMRRHKIPTAEYAEFDDPNDAEAYIERVGAPIVVKADGLAAGKGVTVARSKEEAIQAVREAMVDKAFGGAGVKVVIEEFLEGEEASILAFADGKDVAPMMASQDHKAAYDGDAGPNTGGMGAYSPAPVVTPELLLETIEKILKPCVDGMAAEGSPYKGCLYAGLMITKSGPKVVEFNCRFGDPETQVVLPQLESDIVPILNACCDGTLAETPITWKQGACVTVVMASGGYPREYEKGKIISGLEEAGALADSFVFHAGTKSRDGAIVTNGGRVLNVTAFGADIESTIRKAYDAVSKISFDKAHYRKDIGAKAVARLMQPKG